MSNSDDFDDVRRDPDPIRRGRRATMLMSVYQQRSAELARLRREAIEEAYDRGLTYTEIAAALGITKGRVTQIRTGAPARERAFFGIGPVHIGVPLREGIDDRMRIHYVDVTDLATQEDTTTLLGTLALAAEPFTIPPDTTTPPDGDTVVICGPKSAPLGGDLMDRDPTLGMVRDDDRWWIVDKATGERFGSPLGDRPPGQGDLGYLARHRDGNRVVVHIAGIHSPGSLGVVHYLVHHLTELHRATSDTSFSLAVRCRLDGPTVTGSEILTGPHKW